MDTSGLHIPDVEWEPTRPFWEGCRQRQLRLPRCACGEYVWYPQPRCPRCRGDRIDWVAMSGRATVFTWTTVYRSFVPGHADRVPYVAGIVELAEDPKLRLATFLPDVSADSLQVGMPLRVDFETIREGIVLPVFRPLAER